MNTTISNSGLPKLQQASGQTGGNQATDSSAAAGSSAPAAKTGDQLKLTDSAKALQEAARSSSSASAIDAQRVEKVQKALANGSYKINAGRIADGLISMERQLGGPSKA
jgi:negative regulator of flagellin synthesis FlgM